MLDKVLGWFVIFAPFVLSAIFIFIPSQSQDKGMNMRWRIALVVAMAFYGLLAWYQQKRVNDEQDRKAEDSRNEQKALQIRLDSMDINIGILNSKKQEAAPGNAPRSLGVFAKDTLSLEITGANIFVPLVPQNSTSFVLNVAVQNSSSLPTVAADYKLEVTTPDNVQHDAVFMHLGDKGELRLTSASGVVTVIPASDALEDKTENKEIIAGGAMRGRVYFLLPGVPHDQVVNPQTILTISARNSRNARFSKKESIEEIARK